MLRLLSMLIVALVAMTAPITPVAAQDSLAAAKAAGLVGEKPDGLVGFVAGEVPAEVRGLVDRVNAERRRQYEQVAASTGQSLTEVQAVAGDRLVAATPSGQFVMNAAGRWTRK